MAAQRIILDKMLKQWEESVVYDAPDSSNEVHVAGDMNIDCWEGRWQEPNYSLVTLGRMVMQCCNSNNFSQMVDQITRVQHNSTRGETATSCLDHVYCNAKYRMSKVKVLPFGGSDHDAVLYTRYSKVPKPPSRTIRRRSYKHFIKEDYIRDVTSIDFTDVFLTKDVDEAADILTEKLVQVLNIHAPWIIFQQRKDFLPWLTPETVQMMKDRNILKEELKAMANTDGRAGSDQQIKKL